LLPLSAVNQKENSMRKILLIAALLSLLSTEASAGMIPPPPVGLGVGGGTGASAAGVIAVGMIGAPVLMYLIASGVDPWTGNFHSVVYEYPEAHEKF
jgi:hypothetical protein